LKILSQKSYKCKWRKTFLLQEPIPLDLSRIQKSSNRREYKGGVGDVRIKENQKRSMKKRKRREEEAKVEKQTNQQLFNFRSFQSTNLSINDQMRDIENGCKILRDLSYQKYGEEEEEEDMRWSFIWKFELSLKEEDLAFNQ